MRIVFSDHARQQMKERNLSESHILRVVQNPQQIIEQSRNRFRAVGEISRKKKRYVMIVIYDLTVGKIEIVTAFLSSKLDKYL